MPTPFYRKSESDLASGAANLITIVTPAAATYGLTAGEVTAYTSLSTVYASALTTATEPSTRTSVSIAAKNAAKKALQTASVNVSRTITAVATVSNAQLLSLGLNQRYIPSPRPVPQEPPVLQLVSVSGRVVKVRIRSATSASRGKPFGAVGACLYSYVGPAPTTDPDLYHYEGTATRGVADILFPNSVASGATVWLSAQWVSARGQLSTGSVPISVTVQGGAIPAAA